MRAREFIIERDNIPAVLNGRSTRNSQGNLIHPTEEGIINFWRWFGDSIVVDDTGAPMVCYHGTDKDFDIFDKDVSWFSYDTSLASDYAELRYSAQGGSNVMLCYIRAFRPFNANVIPKGSVTIAAFITNMATQARENGVNIDNPYMINAVRRLQALAKEEESGPYYAAKDFWHTPRDYFGKEGANILTSLFDALQFDSIIYTEEGSPTIGVFSKNSIKSIFNPGKFSHSTKIHEMTHRSPPGMIREGHGVPDEIDGHPTRNNQGRLIHPTSDGIKNFWRWFGSSKVVDDQGRPLVVYHGTKSDINSFTPMRIGKGSTMFGDYDIERHGSFTTPDAALAHEFAMQGDMGSSNIMPLYLKIDNYIDMVDGQYTNELWNQIEQYAEEHGFNPYSMARMFGDFWAGETWQMFDKDANNDPKDWIDMLQSFGYDGALIYEPGPDDDSVSGVSYVTFHPHQIKSAIGNRGQYSKSPKITEKRKKT